MGLSRQGVSAYKPTNNPRAAVVPDVRKALICSMMIILGNTTPKCLYTAQDQSDHRLRVEDVATIERLKAHPVGPTSLFNKELPKESNTT